MSQTVLKHHDLAPKIPREQLLITQACPIQTNIEDPTPNNKDLWEAAYERDVFEPKVLEMLRDGHQTTKMI